MAYLFNALQKFWKRNYTLLFKKQSHRRLKQQKKYGIKNFKRLKKMNLMYQLDNFTRRIVAGVHQHALVVSINSIIVYQKSIAVVLSLFLQRLLLKQLGYLLSISIANRQTLRARIQIMHSNWQPNQIHLLIASL